MIYNSCYHIKKKPRIYYECNTCEKIYPCKSCHDENEDHKIGKNIDKIICGYCKTSQCVSNKCINCGLKFAKNFCKPCKTYLNNIEFFHCDKCNECRVGKKEDSFHCDNCNVCLGIHLKNNHKCRNFKEEICYICLEKIHNSHDKTYILQCCNHAIHKKCLMKLIENNKLNCGLCRKNLLSQFIKDEASI